MGKSASGKKQVSIIGKVGAVSFIMFACLVFNTIMSVVIQYTQIKKNIDDTLNSNLTGVSTMVDNNLSNLNVLISDHSYAYEFLYGTEAQKVNYANTVAMYDEMSYGLTFVDKSGKQYGEGVDSSIVSAMNSQGKLITTPDSENGDFYFGVTNDYGGLITHLKAQKIATFLAGVSCDAFIISNDGTVFATSGVSDYNSSYPEYVQTSGSTYISNQSKGGFMSGYYYAAKSIDGTDWTLLVRASSGEFYSGLVLAFWLSFILVAIMGVLGGITVALMKKTIISPIEVIRGKIVDMSNGNISGNNVEVITHDELGELAEAINKMTEFNQSIISDIKYTAEQIAAQNLLVKPKADYVGDFIPIKNALESIVDSMNEIVSGVESAANEVKSSSSQMSVNSEALSRAAHEETQIVGELHSSLDSVHSQINESAAKAAEARNMGEHMVKAINEGNEKMTSMLEAMDEINQTSSQIANIIKTIDDISFQTNILALNASIEAARAGSAGAGFAVVANQVGSLAEMTAEATKSTTDLIKKSLNAVSNGTQIADETAKMLSGVVDMMTTSSEAINQIADTSLQQAESIKSVVDNVNRISESVNDVNTSADGCAASADTLAEQSVMLYETIDGFITDGKYEKKPKAVSAPVKEIKLDDEVSEKIVSNTSSAPKVAPKSVSKPVAPKAEPKPAATTKPEPKTAAKPTAPKAAAKAEPKPAATAKLEPKTAAKPTAPKTAPKTEPKPAATVKSEPKTAAKPTAPKATPKTEPKPAATVKSEPKTTAKPPVKPVKPTTKPKMITLDENEEKAANELAAKNVAKPTPKPTTKAAAKTEKPASAPKAAAPKPAPMPRTIKLDDDETGAPSGPAKVVTKASMTPVKYTVNMERDKY